MREDTESTTPTFVGHVSVAEADALFKAPVRNGEIDIATREGQRASEIMAGIGATGARGEVAVVADFNEEGNPIDPHYVVVGNHDLGIRIDSPRLDGSDNPSIAGLPSPQEAAVSTQKPK